MKRFAWLMVLPYIVTVSKNPTHYNEPYSIDYIENGVRYEFPGISFEDKNIAEDLAYALNNAHKRRTFSQATQEELSQDRKDVKAVEKLYERTVSFPSDHYWKDSKKADWQDLDANPEKQIKRPEQKPIFNYKSACGQDDCGKESQ